MVITRFGYEQLEKYRVLIAWLGNHFERNFIYTWKPERIYPVVLRFLLRKSLIIRNKLLNSVNIKFTQ